jgi:hypothetical protein
MKIEDETNEISSERKDEINIVDVNDKLQLNKIEKEKVIVINDDNRYSYKKMFNINFNEDNIFTLFPDFYIELQSQSNEVSFSYIFSDENIRMFGIIYTDFRQRISKVYGNIDRKNLTDLYWIFTFGKLPPDIYCLKYTYLYNPHQCWYNKTALNQ